MVVVMKASNRWLGLLGAAVILSFANVSAYSSSSECNEDYYADGACDMNNNRAECGYDSGDCCSCTCVGTEDDYSCLEFACIDPEAVCVDDDDITAEMVENCGYVYGIGNGYCDQENNNALCAYDGGDCCSCTCTSPENSWDDDYSCSEFACIDPEAVCVDDDDITADMVENCEWVRGLGDGYCDQGNNKAECAYDGGDCCSCTCTAPESEWDDDYGCSGNFACIDPEAVCVDDDDITAEMVENCEYVDGVGNGYCDQGNNNAGCGYDGGDCCSCTCTTPETEYYYYDFGCYEFACIDPEAACVDDDDITVDMIENCSYVGSIGNGYCDEDNNNEQCNYDGGDCCECTCVAPETGDDFYRSYDDYVGCGNGFACIDPEARCVNDDDITLDIVANCNSVQVGNGYCDQENNNAECGYDGGDCCECTCEDRPNQKCGQYGGFACIDPEAACVNDDDITVDMLDLCGWVGGIGNGYCDQGNNNAECNYDGGDCCECTCDASNGDDDDACGRWAGFACIDPEAPCVDDDSVTVDMLDNCYAGEIGNGWCDDYNNKAECAYDGGDCCECTCVSTTDDDCRWGFACIDPEAACVNDDDITVDMLDNCGWVLGIGDGYCNQDNNKAECGYDGGDCCECTCVRDENADDYSGGRYSQCNDFACIDPDAACVNDDDITVDMLENCGWVENIGNGYCDRESNSEECGWDGGDCCSCTCESEWDDDWACSVNSGFDCKDTTAPCYGEESIDDDEVSMSYEYEFVNDDFYDFMSPFSNVFIPSEQEGSLPTVEGAVEVGTKTEVGVSATAYDVRPGMHAGQAGCGEVGGDGCAPANTRDGISTEIESRWSCAMNLVEDEGPCVIEYTFSEPQDIMDIQVAFWKGEERIRTLDVHLDGVRAHTHESYAGSTFNTLGVSGTGVTTVALESVELLAHEWISLLEVVIFVPE